MKRIFIFLIGLVFLVIAAEVLLFSPRDVRNVKREGILEDFSDQAVEDAQDNGAAQLLTDLELMEAGPEGKEWTLRAKEAALYPDTNEWKVKGVNVKLYGEDGAEYLVTGDSGKVEIESKDIWVNGNVRVTSENGYVIATKNVVYNGAEKKLTSQEKILMTGPDKQEERPLRVRGTGLSAELKNNRIYLLNDVEASKPMEDEMLLAIESESAEFSGVTRLTKFVRSVVVDYGGTRITGPYAEFQYGKESIRSMEISGGIKVTDLEKWATAREIEMIFPEEKYILRGAPKVVQNNDELVGEEIVFLNGGKEIQVKGARAKFDNERLDP